MITLHLNKPREFKVGEVVHLKVISVYKQAPGKWRLTVDDVTPSPGAEATGYGCSICGLIEEAKPDGSLPEGWIKREFEQGSHFLCRDCKDERICRVCGCSQYNPCETAVGPCHWAEEDLCSACVDAKRLS